MSHLSRRKPNPLEVVNLDPFDQAFLIHTGNAKLINPLVTVAEVLKASGDLILWGPQAALLFRVLMNGWKTVGGDEYTADVVDTFDLDADPITVDNKALNKILKRSDKLGRDHWNEVKEKVPNILFETQYRAQLFFDKRYDEFIERTEQGQSTSLVVFQTELGKLEKVSQEGFDRWFPTQDPTVIQAYITQFPPDVLNPRIAELATQATLKEGVRAVDRAELANRIRNIPAIPHAQFDATGDVEVARAWNRTAVAMMEGYVVSDYQVISERDKRTCPVCQRIDGKVFSAQRAISKMAEYDNITPGNVDAIRDLWRFPRINDVDNVPPDDVQGLDLLPPFHPRCRCEVVLLHSRFSGSSSFEFSNTMSMPRQQRLMFRDRHMQGWDKHRDKTKRAAFRLMGRRLNKPVAVAQHGDNICIAEYSRHKAGVTVGEFYNFGRAQDRTVIENLAQLAKDKKGYLRVTGPASLREVKFLEKAYFKEVKQGYEARGSALDKIIAGKKKRIKKPAKVTPADTVQVPTHADPKPTDYDKALLAVEKDIAGLPKERGVILDSKGNILYQKDGTKNKVSWNPDERKVAQGQILTHNHPSGGSFSPNDIQFLVANDLAEIRAVGANWRHSMVLEKSHRYFKDLIDKGFDDLEVRYYAVRDMQKVYKRKYKSVKKRLQLHVNQGKLSVADANNLFWHEVWTAVSKEVGWLKYQRVGWFESVVGKAAGPSKSLLFNAQTLKIAQSEFIVDLGTIPQSQITNLGGGVNVTQIVKLPNGEKAVFKPVAGEKFGLRGSILNPAAPLAHREALSWEIDDLLGLDLVPETRLVRINGEVGSLQHFKKSAILQGRYAGPLMDKDLAKMDVFDFLIGNTDRHDSNYMRYTRGKLKDRVIAIDNGYVFPRGRSGNLLGVDEYRSRPALDHRSRKPELNTYLSKTERTQLINKLNALDIDQLGRKYSLDIDEITSMTYRRDLLVRLLEKQKLHELHYGYTGWGNVDQINTLWTKYMES